MLYSCRQDDWDVNYERLSSIEQQKMARAYSYDFRQKVIQAIELDGYKKSEASEMFNISRNTIDLWFQRKAATGDVQAKPRAQGSPQRKITDWEAFRAFAKQHEAKTQVEMAALWEGDISDRTISRALAKIGFTRKKNLWVSRTG
ncbi:Mobile element protein [uncultured Leptolyngbya sp.]|uniref:Mobile element protein n=1 Tax=uncultured Leptolyngbya sp. TaxID=332963 RepID=A0A6J4KSY3_9CYAN|nr:Mobile element protein [uncultured Leptolyngbya sp.]